MFNLIKKDFILSRKINIFAVIYGLFIVALGLIMPEPLMSTLLYIFGMTILIFITVIYTNGYDDKYKSEIILNSLPMDRKNIVRAKYMALILFIVISCGTVLIFTNIILKLGIASTGKGASIWNAIFVTNISLIFYSIYYPIYFKVGEGLRSFNTMLWILMVIGPSVLSKLMEGLNNIGYLEKIIDIDINRINIYVLILSLIMFYMSMKISEKIYRTREF